MVTIPLLRILSVILSLPFVKLMKDGFSIDLNYNIPSIKFIKSLIRVFLTFILFAINLTTDEDISFNSRPILPALTK